MAKHSNLNFGQIGITIPCTITISQLSLDVIWWHSVCPFLRYDYHMSVPKHSNFEIKRERSTVFWLDIITKTRFLALLQIVFFRLTVFWIKTIPCTTTYTSAIIRRNMVIFCLPVSEIMSVPKHSNFEIKRLMSSQNAVYIYTVFWLNIITKTRFLAFLQIVFFRLTVFWIFTAALLS